jgi:hypothetical protein
MASILADAVDLVIFPGIGSIDQGLTVRDQWRTGQVVFQFGDNVWITMFPQCIDPRPLPGPSGMIAARAAGESTEALPGQVPTPLP